MDEFTPLAIDTITNVVNVSSLASALLTVGGTALIAAFTLGGGFAVAKKAYRWMVSKV